MLQIKHVKLEGQNRLDWIESSTPPFYSLIWFVMTDIENFPWTSPVGLMPQDTFLRNQDLNVPKTVQIIFFFLFFFGN